MHEYPAYIGYAGYDVDGSCPTPDTMTFKLNADGRKELLECLDHYTQIGDKQTFLNFTEDHRRAQFYITVDPSEVGAPEGTFLLGSGFSLIEGTQTLAAIENLYTTKDFDLSKEEGVIFCKTTEYKLP